MARNPSHRDRQYTKSPLIGTSFVEIYSFYTFLRLKKGLKKLNKDIQQSNLREKEKCFPGHSVLISK